jgi:methyltransferase (TIGR00027 family)
VFQGLKRVVYRAADLAAGRQWYSEVLGTEPVYESPIVVVFNVGDCSLSLMVNQPALPEDNGRVLVYWQVEDVDAVHAKLIAAGARARGPMREIFMIRVAEVVDPFGNILGLTGSVRGAKDQTVENRPSQTALMVTFCRAMAAHDERPEIKGGDRLAELFLDDERRALMANPAARAKFISEFLTSRRYGCLTARTAFGDRLFEDAVRQRVPQIVFLGAGYDTKAHRFAPMLGGTTVFELDISTTQNHKKSVLQKAGIAAPPQLRYVAINFKTDDLGDRLREAGFDKSRKTLFIWEGVTYYLTADVIDATLAWVHENAPAGSTIFFDYLNTRIESAVPGEPFLFWLAKEKLEGFLRDRGFSVLEHLDSRAIERKLLSRADGTVLEGSLPQFCFARAAVV